MSIIHSWKISTHMWLCALVKKRGTQIEHNRFIPRFSVGIWWTQVFGMCSNSASVRTDWCWSSQITAPAVLTFVSVLVVVGQSPWEINAGDSRPSENFLCRWKIVECLKLDLYRLHHPDFSAASSCSLKPLHIYRTSTFVCLKWIYADSTAKANAFVRILYLFGPMTVRWFVCSRSPCVDAGQLLTNPFSKRTKFADKCSSGIRSVYVYAALHKSKSHNIVQQQDPCLRNSVITFTAVKIHKRLRMLYKWGTTVIMVTTTHLHLLTSCYTSLHTRQQLVLLISCSL